MPASTGARLARGFLSYLLAVICLVTLAPFAFRLPEHPALLWEAPGADFIANILLFVPLGFLYRLTRPADRDRLALRALGIGAAFSALIESAQLFLPTRFSAPADILANGAGAWLGALALDSVTRHLAEPRRTFATLTLNLTLELPLMGPLYLLVPLLWLHGLAHGSTRGAAVMALPLGLIGGVILAALHRYRFGPAGSARPLQVAAAAGVWFALGVLPGALVRPGPALGTTLVVSLWTLLLARAPVFNVERRFEGETLRRIAPLYALFLVLLYLGPALRPSPHWHGALGSAALWRGATTEAILRVLEQVAAFTVVGYIVAELRGRREAPFASSWGAVALVASIVAVAMEGVAGWQAGPGASLLRAITAVLAAVHGGWIYHLQREHVRALLRESPRFSFQPSATGRQPSARIAEPSIADG